MRPLFLSIDEERLLSTEYRGVDRSTQETGAGFEHQLNHMYLYAKTKRNLLILWSFSTLGCICWAAVKRLKYCQYGVKHYPTNLFVEENVLFDFNENMAVFLYKCTSILFSNFTMELTTDFIFFHSKVQWKSTIRSQSRWKSSTSCIFNKKKAGHAFQLSIRNRTSSNKMNITPISSLIRILKITHFWNKWPMRYIAHLRNGFYQ